MKMEEAVEKLKNSLSLMPPKTSEQETAKEEDGSVELESQVPKDGVVDSTVLLQCPACWWNWEGTLPKSQLASTESDSRQLAEAMRVIPIYCMLSPSSSGHLADSDTLSSAEENEPFQAETAAEGTLPECLCGSWA